MCMCKLDRLCVFVRASRKPQNSLKHRLPTAHKCQHYSLIYLTAHCILGVVVCLKGLPVSLLVACTSGTGVLHWTEPHLSLWQTSSSTESVLLDSWTADTPHRYTYTEIYTHIETYTSSSLLHFLAQACGKIVSWPSFAYWSAWTKEIEPQHFTE